MYGLSLLAPAFSYFALQTLIIREHGHEHVLKRAIGGDWKSPISIALYVARIGAAFYDPRIAQACYVAVASIWFVPDRRIERAVTGK